MSKKSHLSLIVLKSEKSLLFFLLKILFIVFIQKKKKKRNRADEENLIYTTDVLEMKILRTKMWIFFYKNENNENDINTDI